MVFVNETRCYHLLETRQQTTMMRKQKRIKKKKLRQKIFTLRSAIIIQ